MGRRDVGLVGREAERGRLSDALQRAADEPELVLISGEAGIGKSRLVDDVAGSAAEMGWRVLVGHCLPLSDGGPAYAPWIEMLRRLARAEGRPSLQRLVGEDGADLAPLLLLREPVGTAGPPTARVLEALLALVERMAEARPLLLAIEDLHWADEASLDALAFLLRNLADVPVLLLGTWRTDEDARGRALLTELRRSSRANELPVGPLDVDSVRALIEALGAPADAAEGLHRRAGGNPYYLTELVAAGDRPVTHLTDVVLARLDGLPAVSQEVLASLAVAGQPVPHPLLQRVTGLAESALAGALHGLLGRRLVRAGDDGYAPAHALAAESVLAGLLPGERAALHKEYAEALEADPSLLGDPSGVARAVAEHRCAGADPVLALCAATRALAAADAPSAVRRWSAAALERWPLVPETQRPAGWTRGALLERAAHAALLSGHPAEAVVLLQEALDEPDSADALVAGARGERLAHCLWSAGRSVEAADVNRRALELLCGEPSLALARAQAGYASTLMVLGEWDEAETYCKEALLTAAQVGAASEQAHAQATLGVVLVSAGKDEPGLAALDRACELARDVGDARLLWRNLLNASYARELAGDVERAAGLALEALALVRRHGLDASAERSALANAIPALVELGRWGEAAALLDEAPEGECDDPRVRKLERSAATLAVARGEPVPEHVLDGHEDEPRMRQQRDLVRADRALWSSDPASALSAVTEGLAAGGSVVDATRLRATGLRALADLLSLPVGAGGPGPADRAAMLDRVDAELALLPSGGSREMQVLAALGRAEAARARGDDRPEDWSAVAAGWQELGRPYAVAVAQWRQAACAAEHGTRPDVLVRAAHELAAGLGARPLQHQLELLAVRVRVDLGRAPEVPAQPGPLDGLALTRRERQVLELLATGASNRRIARRLSITENTAGVHVSNVLRKLGVANRSEATAVAHRLGLAAIEGETA